MVTLNQMSENLYESLIKSIIHENVLQSELNGGSKVAIERKVGDIYGHDKTIENGRYFNCDNCGREIAGNRFAAHVDRCLGGRSRK